jgi:hypothetical protein
VSEQTKDGDDTEAADRERAVQAAQGPSPDDGVHAGEKDEGSDASPGAWTAAAAPGKPDGEVDTRSG